MRKTLLAALLLLPLTGMALEWPFGDNPYGCESVKYSQINVPNVGARKNTAGCFAKAIRTSSFDPQANINTVMRIYMKVKGPDNKTKEAEFEHMGLSPTQTSVQWRPHNQGTPYYHGIVSCYGTGPQPYEVEATFSLGYYAGNGWNETHTASFPKTTFMVQRAGQVCQGANSNHGGDGWKWRMQTPSNGW